MARMKTVRVKPEVYEAWADYSAEHGVTIGEAAAILAGGLPESEAPEPEVIELEDERGSFDELHGRFDRLEEGMARGFAGTFAGQQSLADQLGGDPDELAEAQIAAVEGELPPRLADHYGKAARKALSDGPDTRRR